jgi:sulfoxide reductase catalytic subunit YedY
MVDAARFWAPSADVIAGARNQLFTVDRELTDEGVAAHLNHFVELTPDRDAHRFVTAFRAAPHLVSVTGLVERNLVLDVDDLTRLSPLEERVYRHRCVEGWAAAVPWLGIPLSAVLRAARPLRAARYVHFVSRPPERSEPSAVSMPSSYSEALTIAEAANELAFLATGIYGHALPLQHGAPVRLVVPWKYAHKSIKAIARIELTAVQPPTHWNSLAPDEYPFLANVDPLTPHPRWSQRSEKMLGSCEVRATLPFNGYGEWVGHLYT